MNINIGKCRIVNGKTISESVLYESGLPDGVYELYVKSNEQETIEKCAAYLKSKGYCLLAKQMIAELKC